ncbi:MAG: TonB-dependent receptor [Bacteroidales bacterium]
METLKLIFLAIMWTLTTAMNGQTGAIEGIVKDHSTGSVLPGATVIIEGTNTGTATDPEGKFRFTNLKPGLYNLKITYVSYLPETIEKVKVEQNKTTQVEAVLKENTVSLSDVTVTAVRKTNTELSIISDIKTNAFVTIGISGQQISKTLDKDASEVVRRVPGITIQDDRFIIVRGLSERYNNVWLNNAATPSAEADVRAFSFDVIPGSMIENIMIIKSSAAELPADFSGGFVKITTRNMPEKNSIIFSYSTAFNEGSTFRKFNKYDGSSTDILGFDDGIRALPEGMPAHLNEYESATNPAVRERITAIGRSMNKIWLPYEKIALPDQKILLGINRKFEQGKFKAGNTTAISWSWSDNIDLIEANDYTIYDYVNDRPLYLNQFYDKHYTNSARVSIMHNWAFLAERSRFEIRNLFNQAGYTRTIERKGREWYNDGRYIYSEELRYMSRSIYTGQITGSHSLNNSGSSKIEWIAGYSSSGKNEPDTKRYRYIRNPQDTTKYILLFSDNADLSSVSRMWIKLNESTLTGSLNLTLSPAVFNGKKAEIKTGVYFESKSRSFRARNFGYAKGSLNSGFSQTSLPITEIFRDENINLTDGIKLVEMTALSDSYTASNLQMAAYASARIPITSRLNLYSGVRIERNKQTLSSYKQGSTVRVDVDRDSVNVFPSVNLTYNFSEKSLVRAAYGMTINRPEFREIAPFYYVDFELNAGIYGEPEIRQAYIHNFDIRYELYPENGEMFSIGIFYKDFLNPIEQVILGNSPTQYSFRNVKSAYSAGIEAELRKSLAFIPGMEDFNLVLNGSLIKSRVHFEEGSLYRNRPLEGQSPYIINAGLFYQNNEKGLMMSLLYNVIGKRITAVGRPSPNQWEDIPDIYEMPRNVIDLTFSKTLGNRIEIKGGIKDILNQPVRFVQNVNATVDMNVYARGADTGMKYFDRNQVTKYYIPGRTFIIGVSLKF